MQTTGKGQPRKGKGGKTSTHRISGQTYQVRLLTCGKEGCRVCDKDGGHTAVYHDTGPGSGRWQYVGSRLPDPDPDYTPPTCQNPGCDNELSRSNQKHCSPRCKMAHRRQLARN